MIVRDHRSFFFFFNDTATTEIYTLSLHDALPISNIQPERTREIEAGLDATLASGRATRSEEHTSELQSQSNLVCRLLLEKKKTQHKSHPFVQPEILKRHPHQPTLDI